MWHVDVRCGPRRCVSRWLRWTVLRAQCAHITSVHKMKNECYSESVQSRAGDVSMCEGASKCSCTADQPVLEGRTAQSRVALATRGSASLSLSPATRAVEKRNRHHPGTSRGQAWLLYGCDPHALLKELATRGLQPRRQQVVVIPLVQEREGGLRCSIQLRLHLLPRAVRRKVLW